MEAIERCVKEVPPNSRLTFLESRLFGYRPAVWFAVLGHLEVRRSDGTPLPIAGPARRQLLAALLSRPGALVTSSALIDDLWGAAPPRSAANTLHSHVARLRTALAEGGVGSLLRTEGEAYRLCVEPQQVDAGRFEALVDEANRTGDARTAIERYDEALALWRDDPYVEFGDAAFAVLERIRLGELRAAARERRTDLALASGASGELVAELEQRVRTEPYRERGWEQLALTLYRAGRQADALAACRRARDILLEDLGVDPGPGLQALEERLLRQDPALLVEPAPPPPAAVLDRCPYLGLGGYEEQDAALFVGRERLTSTLAGRLADQSVVVVTGASGVGKSSLVRAGLVPALRAGALPGSAAWRIDVRTPADAPLAGTDRRPDLLVLDQAEELFTGFDPDARDELVRRLARFVEEEQGRLVFVLRSDFYGRLAEAPTLAPFAEKSAVLVGPMRADELRRALVEPAAAAGLRLEDELVETIMDAVAGQPEPLPLLSEVMVRTWQRRDADLLTLEGYRRAGELAGALEAAAEECYARLDQTQRPAARHLLVRLAARTESGWVRRPLTRAAPVDEAERVALTALIDARLVVADERRVEITHDALLAHWPRLRDWLEERSLAAELLQHLDQAATDWHGSGRQDSDLYRGPRLSAAMDWRDQHPEELSAAEDEFLDASARASETELAAARAQTRRFRAIALVLAAVVVAAVVAAVIAVQARSSARRAATRAEQAALTADARRLAALSANAPDIATSSLLAVAAYRLQDSPDTRGALLSAVERNQSALWELAYDQLSPDARPEQIAVSPDGTRIAISGTRQDAPADHEIVVIDSRTRKRISEFAVVGFLRGFTDDGKQVVDSGPTNAATPVGELALYDLATGREHVITDAENLDAPQPVVSTDGRWIVAVTTHPARSGFVADVIDTRHPGAAPRQFGTAMPTKLAAGARTLALEFADGSVDVRDVRTLRLVARIPAPATPGSNDRIALAPDGSRVVRADPSDPTRASIYDLATHDTIPLPRQAQTITDMRFSPDGAELAIGSTTGSLNVYRVSDGAQLNSYAGHAGPLFDIAWAGHTTPTGLYTVGLDNKVISWDLEAGPRTVSEFGADVFSPPGPSYLSQHGSVVVGVSQDPALPHSTRRLFTVDLRTGAVTSWLMGLQDDEGVTQVSASDDGHYGLVSITVDEGPHAGDNRDELYDLRSHRDIGRLHFPGSINFADGYLGALSPDGTRAYAQVSRTRVGVFAVPSGRFLHAWNVLFAGPDGGRLEVNPWQFDPSGRLVVSGFDAGPDANGPPWVKSYPPGPAENRLGLLDVRSGKLVGQTVLPGTVASALAWSHDGRTLAVGAFDGGLTLVDARTLARRVAGGSVSASYVDTVSFSPDDHLLALGGLDGSLSFFSASDLAREGQRILVGNSANNGGVWAWYRPNGDIWGQAQDPRHADSELERTFTMTAAPAGLAALACQLAGSDITHEQWQRYVGDRPYQHVCPG